MTYNTPENVRDAVIAWKAAQLDEIRRDDAWANYSAELQQRTIEDVRRRVPMMVEAVLQAMDDRDIKTLESFLWRTNKQSCALFAKLSGLKLGRTQKSIDAALRQFIGADVYDAYKQKLRDESKQHADQKVLSFALRATAFALGRKARWVEHVFFNNEQQSVEHEGTIKEFIDWCVDRGFAPQTKRRGVTNELRLMREDGRFYTVRGNFRYLLAYAQQQYVVREQAQTDALA